MTGDDEITTSEGATAAFRQARDFLQAHREDYDTAYRDFGWPDVERFNYATDWVDVLAAEHPSTTALWIVDEDGSETKLTFGEVVELSQRLASYLDGNGVKRGDRVLLLLGNVAPLWVSMLACIRLGAVMIPATTLLSASDLEDRISRGNVRAVVAGAADTGKFADVEGAADLVKVSVGDGPDGWLSYDAGVAEGVEPLLGGDTAADDTLLLYFTSGTTAQPKLVEHTHTSYPLGHLSTMYWIGLQPGDLHLNISSPGWAKHAWSCFFAPWNAGATIVIYNFARFDADRLLDVMERVGGDDLLRAADRLADAHAGRPRLAHARAPGGRRCRRAAQPRGDRADPEVVGTHRAGRLRPDGDHRPGRQLPRPAASSSARWAGRCRGTSSRSSTRSPARSGPTARSAWSWPADRSA